MRAEFEITEELEEVQKEYHDNSDDLTKSQKLEFKETLRNLRIELVDLITNGANGCYICSNTPHGIHQPKYYEIGCLDCRHPGNDDSNFDYPVRSKGSTREKAVDNWNKGIYFYKDSSHDSN